LSISQPHTSGGSLENIETERIECVGRLVTKPSINVIKNGIDHEAEESIKDCTE